MFSPHSHSGFYQATISKCLLAIVVVSSIVLTLPLNGYRSFFINASKASPAYTYATSKLVFFNTKDLIPGGLLLYYFRIFERRYGQRKFFTFIMYNLCGGLLLEAIVFNLLYKCSLNHRIVLPCGPVSLIFSFFIPFYCELPRVAVAHICGIPVTGKSFVYLLGLQLAHTSWGAMLLAAAGLLTGCLWQSQSSRICHWLAPPRFICKLASDWLEPLLSSSAPVEQNKHLGATLELQRQQQMDQWEQQMRARWAVPPSEEQINRLTDMGFSRDSVEQALRASNNNLNMAMNALLNES